jgi:hypothetical protein
VRACIGGLALVILVVTAFVQWCGDALYGNRASARSLPAAMVSVWPLEIAERLQLDAFPSARLPLARAAIERGEFAFAQRLLEASAPGPERDELRGRLAERTGDAGTSLQAFLDADDFVSARAAIDARAGLDPVGTYALLASLEQRLLLARRTPEVLADVAWRTGQVAAQVAYQRPALRDRYTLLSLAAYRRALALAPREETYLLAYANEALFAGDAHTARVTFERAYAVAAVGFDALVGMAASDALLGDCRSSSAELLRARQISALDENALAPTSREALARCR